MRKQRSYFFKNLLKATHTKVSKIQGQHIWLQNLFSSIQNAAFDLLYPLDYEPPPQKTNYHSILISFKHSF